MSTLADTSVEANQTEQVAYTFELNSAGLPTLNSDDNKDNLFKWNLSETLKAYTFRSNEGFIESDSKNFVKDFFNDKNVQYALSRELGMSFGSDVAPSIEELNVEAITTSILTETLEENNIASGAGWIRGRIMETVEGVDLHDTLREAIWDESSELYDAYSSSTRKELLFALFKIFVLGGATNQYEDKIEPYVNITKSIYKDLVSVKKNPEGDLQIVGHAFLIRNLGGKGGSLFNCDPDLAGNVCLLVVDPLSRRVVLLHNHWKPNQWW